MNLGCWPKPGDIGTLSPWTTVTLTQPSFAPPGKVTCPGPNVSEKPGASGMVNVPPPVAAVTQSLLIGLSGSRKIGWPTVLFWPATVTISYSRLGYVPVRCAVLPSTSNFTKPTGAGLIENWPCASVWAVTDRKG